MDENTELAIGKQRLRAVLLKARRERSAAERERDRRAVADVVVELAAAGNVSCVAAYEPMATEPGSVELLQRLVALGIEVLVPVTLPDRDLDWTRWVSAPAANAAAPSPVLLGTDAIAEADAVIVPALAVGRDGSRLGRGGGSYDRALLRCSAHARLSALLFDTEVLDTVPVQPWDVRVHSAITPSGLLALDGNRLGNTAVASDD